MSTIAVFCESIKQFERYADRYIRNQSLYVYHGGAVQYKRTNQPLADCIQRVTGKPTVMAFDKHDTEVVFLPGWATQLDDLDINLILSYVISSFDKINFYTSEV